MNEYQQLLDALDTNDFQSSMDLFDKAMESYKASGDVVIFRECGVVFIL